jgi:hypothetical protein
MKAALFQESLNQLRQAAVKDAPHYDALQRALLPLFQLAEAAPAIKFVLEQLWDYLPQFESHYPNQRWPRETLIQAGRLAPFDVSSLEVQFFGSIRLEDEDQHPIPGALPFVNALEESAFTTWGRRENSRQSAHLPRPSG